MLRKSNFHKRFRIVWIVPVLFLCSCDTGSPLEQGNPNFGAVYRVLNATMQSGDSLQVIVAYSGCSGNRQFTLRYKLRELGVTEVWYFIEGENQPCDAYFTQKLQTQLPFPPRTQVAVYLLVPNGVPIKLR